MKKALSLLLALAICLSLCACGGSKAESAAAPTEAIEVTASAFADHPLLPRIYGTWEFEKWGDHNNEYQLYKSLTINEDGSCIVDGTSANWGISEAQTNDTFLVILVYIDSECIYGAQFGESTDADGNAHVYLHAFEGEYGAILPTTFIQRS